MYTVTVIIPYFKQTFIAAFNIVHTMYTLRIDNQLVHKW
jgi:hypothetical protein